MHAADNLSRRYFSDAFFVVALTHLPVLSADNFYNKFGPRSGSKLFDTLPERIFLKS